MKLLALYWSFMVIAYILALRLKKKGFDFSWTSPAMMVVVYLLCFDMGLRMGINEEVTSSIGSIGLISLIITACCVCGSMGAITVTRKIFGMNRYGDLIGKETETVEIVAEGITDHAEQGAVNKDSGKSNIRTTVTILLVVIAGLAIGAFVITKVFAGNLDLFDMVSYRGLIVLLCILLFFVGFNLGSKGGILETIKTVGFRILAFPIAAMIGTMIVGTIACLIMSFSLKESLAICAGFGWYSYAPIVIAGAGNQYIVASAVSFMHNVMRETAGIILIPLFARKFGYIECTGVPGSAAMDVCMPIVEHSCRPDTAIYSFITGFFMCIATSIGVPLIMSF